MKSKRPALVVLSGGQDSLTVLHCALERHDVVHTITFDYGQRHAVEIACAAEAARRNGCANVLVDLPDLSAITQSALLNKDQDVGMPHTANGDLPASFVPGRNAIFLTLAFVYAMELGAVDVYAGMCQTDYSGYPDCRAVFIDRLKLALNTGYRPLQDILIHTPLMFLDKAQTFALADRLGCLEEVIEHSHTCYNGDRSKRHSWGYGCGKCPACKLRADGFVKFTGRAG